MSGHVGEASGATNDPSPPAFFHSGALPRGSSVTLRPRVSCSGENEVFENVSQSIGNVTDMEIEPNFSEFDLPNPVKSSAVVNQFDSVVQREVKQSLADMEVCSNGSSCANVIRMKQPVVNVCFDASAFGEVNEVSHNPSSRSTLPMTGESGSVSPCLLYTSPSPRDGLLSRMPSSA